MKTKLAAFISGFETCVILTLLMSSCSGKEETESIPKYSDAVSVKVMSLEQQKNFETILSSGQLVTNDETVLSFKVGGVVEAVLVETGDRVKKGQLLARLNLTEINVMVAQARQGYEKASRDFQRATALYKDSVATLEQLQNAETGLIVAKEQLEAANFNRAFSEIHAPANGFVLHKFVNPGQMAGAGAPILITNGAAQGKWILKVGVSDKQWAVIKTPDTAIVTIDAFPDRSFQGIVIRKSERADPQTGAFTIELEVNSDDKKFASGMFASAQIHSGHSTSSWSVPYEAVLDANGNEGFVFITNDNKTAIRQAVKIESFNGNTIRIREGLEHAQALIISGSAYLTGGSQLQIINKP